MQRLLTQSLRICLFLLSRFRFNKRSFFLFQKIFLITDVILSVNGEQIRKVLWFETTRDNTRVVSLGDTEFLIFIRIPGLCQNHVVAILIAGEFRECAMTFELLKG